MPSFSGQLSAACQKGSPSASCVRLHAPGYPANLNIHATVTSFLAQAVREQIRKLAVGGPPGKGDTAVYQVSDSEDEDLEDSEDIRCHSAVWFETAQC
eukprot:44626-Pelagomonas_calceolata.AAC.3